ncbi:NifB/NifX family molybdenum-iron cluster-binding protein [bacterium]|nr:NifB/NifX family molybdenum-iron cluster-binding protein [candidate division CSSED10-310 bacterium]
MKVAIPHWQGRISPVFDVADNVLIVEIDGEEERSRENLIFTSEEPQVRAAFLADSGVDVLICGAISWFLELAVSVAGVRVISNVFGDVSHVLSNFKLGRPFQDALFPARSGRRRFRARRGRNRC